MCSDAHSITLNPWWFYPMGLTEIVKLVSKHGVTFFCSFHDMLKVCSSFKQSVVDWMFDYSLSASGSSVTLYWQNLGVFRCNIFVGHPDMGIDCGVG